VPISAKLIADLITVAGANRILAMDLHAGPIQGFFNIPVDHLYAMPVLLDYIKKQNISDLVIVSPDAGGVERARAFAKRLNSALAIIDKRRESPNQAEVMNIIGDVQNKHALLFDDMIDTAGTIVQTAQTCLDNGARSVWAGSTHAVLSGPALEALQGSCLREVVVTNTIPLNGKDQQCPKLKTLTVAPLLGEAILRIHREESVTSLFV
jgi:ribose-phosphate pyrophosphokinase